MANRYDICTGRKDRDGKTFWTKIGAMFPAREGGGFTIKLDALPLPNKDGEVWMSAFVPRPRDGDRQQSGGGGGGGRPTAGGPDDSDIPFACEWR